MSVEHVSIRVAAAADAEALCEIQVSAIRQLGLAHYSRRDVDAWAGGLKPDHHAELVVATCVLVPRRPRHTVQAGVGAPRRLTSG